MTGTDQPHVWDLPAEPGTEVTAVRDRDGFWWRRLDDVRWYPGGPGDEAAEANARVWPELLSEFGPLTDATEAARNAQTGDDQ